MTTTKTDNRFLESKLELRRYFLKKYHGEEPIDVLDCCQGDMVIWSKLREEFFIRSYFGVDKKKKKGRLLIDSERILEQPGWTQNVIDIDTYGSPWNHYLKMLPNVTKPLTVFLTAGMIRIGGGSLSNVQKNILGLNFKKINPSPALLGKLNDFSFSYVLCSCSKYGIMIEEAIEAFPQLNARYIGVRLIPISEEN